MPKKISEKNGCNKNLIFLLLTAAIFAAAGIFRLTFKLDDVIYDSAKNCILWQIMSVLSVAMVAEVHTAGFITAIVLDLCYCAAIVCAYFSGTRNVMLVDLLMTSSTFITLTVFYLTMKSKDSYIARISQNESLIGDLKESEKKNKKRLEKNREQLYRLAYYDQLTGLSNRVKMQENIEALIGEKANFSLIFIGLDNFKFINESKGHEMGDAVLKEAAQRITSVLTDTEYCSRFGGDEFAVLTCSRAGIRECAEFISEIQSALAKPFELENSRIYVNASIGTAFYPKDGADCTELIRNSYIALDKAKSTGKNKFVLFNRAMQTEIDYHNKISMMMQAALDNNEFHMVYQPQFYPNKKLRGFEALVRWNSPELGVISPVSFIPVAEENGFIVKLGAWILKTACQKLKEITDMCGGGVLMSVNISSKQFGEPDFMKTVSSTLFETGADSSLLELEVTETILLASVEETSCLLSRLRKMNIKVSMDDFGTGYSSLSYLRTLPIDTLKIDKSFIDVINSEDESDASGKTVVDTIIKLSHTLGMTVIAEGVEYQEQLEYLNSCACDCIQGFLFSRPLESDDVDELVKEYKK